MEGYTPQTDLQLTSLTYDGNPNLGSTLAENHAYHHYMMEAGRYGLYGNHLVPPTLPHWHECQQTPHTYVKYLAESGVSEILGEISNSNSGMSSSCNPSASFIDMGAQKVRYPRSDIEEALLINFSSTEHDIHVQVKTNNPPAFLISTTSSTSQEPNAGHHNALPSQTELRVSNSGLPPNSRRNHSRQKKSAETDRRRRLRIGVAVDALQELLPPHKDGRRATLLDDLNDYIKYLQLQIKELSQNRLGGESTSNPFIFLEGYGHFLLHEHKLGKTLEEMMGKLLQVNPSAASQLMQSRGLFMMPMALAEGLE